MPELPGPMLGRLGQCSARIAYSTARSSFSEAVAPADLPAIGKEIVCGNLVKLVGGDVLVVYDPKIFHRACHSVENPHLCSSQICLGDGLVGVIGKEAKRAIGPR